MDTKQESLCPTCHKAPTLTTDEHDAWLVECAEHGHMAKGDTLEEAIHHWNLYVAHIRGSL